MSALVIPICILGLFVFAFAKKVDCYSTFVLGVSKAIELCKTVFPFIASVLIAVALIRESGLINIIINLCSPLFGFIGIPPEVIHLVLLRPFTGSGSFAILSGIFSQYGPDSYISRCAGAIMGSSETVFYVSSIYFSKTKVTKLLYAIPVALICSLFSAMLACLFCRVL